MDKVEMKDALVKEKNRRIYYQDIVYAVALSVERALGMIKIGEKLTAGTVDEPSQEIQIAVDLLCREYVRRLAGEEE